MTNIFFNDEQVTKNDVYFICYMIERVARKIKQRNSYVVNAIGDKELTRLLCLANVLHSENPVKTEDEWIDEYELKEGTINLTDIDNSVADEVPTATQMGKVYKRLIFDTLQPEENYVQAMIRVYNHPICDIIDNYNSSAYYEPSYVIARAYNEGGF